MLTANDIESVGDDTYIVRARGHHDPHEFMRAVRAAGYDWPLGMPEQTYARTVPSRNDEYSCMYVTCHKPGPGAYPVTYASEAYNDATYESIVAASGRAQRTINNKED